MVKEVEAYLKENRDALERAAGSQVIIGSGYGKGLIDFLHAEFIDNPTIFISYEELSKESKTETNRGVTFSNTIIIWYREQADPAFPYRLESIIEALVKLLDGESLARDDGRGYMALSVAGGRSVYLQYDVDAWQISLKVTK